MAMGKRRQRQEMLFVSADRLPKSQGHPFYEKLNALLAEAGFDCWVEKRCQQYYEQEEKRGQPSLPPGVYFRMLLVGYFEGIDSQRGIAWRCADSLSLRQFLGIPLNETTPDHSTLTNTRKRLPPEVFEEMFQFVLGIAVEKKLLSGQTVGVDSTTLEANAAMKSILRRDTCEDWKHYVTRLMHEQGVIPPEQQPSDEEIRRFDKQRKDKKVSNEEWFSPNDPDARITHMKDGTTHLAYKAEHAVDLETELILSAEVYYADEGDATTLEDTVQIAQANLRESGSEAQIRDVAADKGYHSNEAITTFAEETPYRTYIPEPKRPAGQTRVWVGKPPEQRDAVYANRRRTRGQRGKRLQRLRSERVERSFAHVCETGGARRTSIRGIEEVNKRYVISAMAHNLGRLMRELFGMGTPRGLQKGAEALAASLCAMYLALIAIWSLLTAPWRSIMKSRRPDALIRPARRPAAGYRRARPNSRFSTGC